MEAGKRVPNVYGRANPIENQKGPSDAVIIEGIKALKEIVLRLIDQCFQAIVTKMENNAKICR